MGQDINVNGTGVNPKEKVEQPQNKEALAEQTQAKLNNDLTNGLSGGSLNLNSLNSGLGFGGIFGASQLNVDEQKLSDLSNSFLGFTLGASNMPFGLGENLMSGAMDNWFQSFMSCFTGGTPPSDAIGADVKTTLIAKPEAAAEEIAEETVAEEETTPAVTTPDAAVTTATTTSAATNTTPTPAVTTAKATKTQEAKAEADNKSLKSNDLTTKNKEQFLMWLDNKNYKSKMDNDQNLIDYTNDKGKNVRIRFNDAGQPTMIVEQNKTTNISYFKDGSKSVQTKTIESERYTYSTVTDYNAKGNEKSYKQTEKDSGNYFARKWQGAIAIKNNVLDKREYGLTKPIAGVEKEVSPPAFKSGNAGFQYDPQKGTLDGKDVTYTKGADDSFSKVDKKTGITCEYDKDGKLLKQTDPKQGIVRDFNKDGSYNELYKKEWVKP